MLIDKIRKEMTREEFKKCFKNDGMGTWFEYNNIMYTCPRRFKIKENKILPNRG